MNITTEITRELLNYEPETGVFTWNTRARNWFKSEGNYKRGNAKNAGEAAGCIGTNARGYPVLVIRVLGKMHKAARLAFLWMGEPLPEQVDHDNGDSLNQAWANLKPSSAADNNKNLSMYRNNTSGITGVFWNEATDKWKAQVRSSGKQIYLGLFYDINEAAAAVSTFHAANGFTARHGQNLSAYQEAP